MGILSVVCALAMAVATKAQAIDQVPNLADLISNQTTLQIGDKLFADWGFSSSDYGKLSASQVTVQLIQDQDGNYGLTFGGPFFITGNSSLDFHLEFSVAVSPDAPDNYISDVHLFIPEATFQGGGGVVVTEQVHETGPIPLSLPPMLVVQADSSNPPDSLHAAADLPEPLKRVYIRKDVTLIAGNGTGVITGRSQLQNFVGLSYIDQTFSQIPEPGTVMLVATGIFGLCLTGRRSRK